MAGINSAYEQELNKRLGSGVATPYSGARTRGGEIVEGIASGVQGLGEFAQSTGIGGQYGPLEMLAIKGAEYFNAPSSGLLEEIETEKDIASGIGRPREIQEQIDIFDSVPGADPLVDSSTGAALNVELINKLAKNQSKGRNSKPFPVEEAAKLKAENRTKRQIELYGSGAGDEAKAQDMIVAKRKKQELADANREASLDMPSMSDDPAEQLFAQAMTDYISKAREGAEGQLPKVGDIEAYKKKFAEATGVDISGKPDTSQALMAMGLSMMQNRAGKGFNVGRMLSSVGEAGEKALPALTAAKAEARANQVAAGKYALDMESKDETKREAAKKEMSALGQYFILPKGDGVAGSVSSILDNKGSYETISKGELQQLMKNPEFASKYDVLPGSMYKEIMLEAMATPEAEENWLTKTPRSRQLMAGIDDPIFNIEVFVGKPGGKKEGQAMVADKGQVQNAYRAFAAMDRDNERLKEKFLEAGYLTKTGAVNVGSAIVGSADSFLSAFGINFKEGATDQEKLDYILNDLKAGNASRILGESGKTISDGDRLLVESIVGNRTILSNPDELEMKLNKLFTSIYTTANNQVMDGLQNLDAISGQNVAGYLNSEKPLTKEEQEELRGFLGGSLAAPRYETDTPSLGRGQ